MADVKKGKSKIMKVYCFYYDLYQNVRILV
jgi:hypothetical protein